MEGRIAISVSELNEYVRLKLAGDPLLRDLEVTGEISGYRQYASGHRYFNLKDEGGRVQCVMFRQYAMGLDFRPQDGMRVTVRASASLFVRDGSYQLYVNSMRQEGAGRLFERFEALKRKLSAEGLFDPARKREIPFHPRLIGVATSKDGAAVRDIIRVAKRRDPSVGIIIAPCAVQGENASDEIVRAIRRINEDGRADVLLVGRGGGSMEDLWPFNEEKTARAIAASRIPVISCVGHEIDFTIADFVADVRAATPSMAAEMAVPVAAELAEEVEALEARLARALDSAQTLRRARLERIKASRMFRDPEGLLLERRKSALEGLEGRMESAYTAQISAARAKLDELSRTLMAVSPEGVLRRGYAAVRKGRGYAVRAAELSAGDSIEIIMADGSRRASITEEEQDGV